MQLVISAAATALFLMASGVAFADDDACNNPASQTQSAINAITQKFNAKLADEQNQIKVKASESEEQTNKDKPNNPVEGDLKFKIDVSSHIETMLIRLTPKSTRFGDDFVVP